MTGSPLDLRFPGQWFQSESGLHQNWMRDYDPTTGRYLQADPLGLVDGASVYGYVGQNPGRYVDPRGEFGIPGAIAGAIVGGTAGYLNSECWEATVIGAFFGGISGGLGGSLTPVGSGVMAFGITLVVQITTNGMCADPCEEVLPTIVLIQAPRFWLTAIGGGLGGGLGAAGGSAVSNGLGSALFGSGPMFYKESLRKALEEITQETITGGGGAGGELVGNGLSTLFR